MNSLRTLPMTGTQWRPLFAALLALVLAATAASASDLSDANGPAIAALPRASPPAGMSVSMIHTGHIEARASMAFAGGRPDDMRRFALAAVLVRHPRGDVLVDAGIGRHWRTHLQELLWIQRKTMTVVARAAAADQLAAHGYRPERLSAIVLTHAHWDHVSGVEDFPDTPLWLSADESAFVAGAQLSTRLAGKVMRGPTRPFGFHSGPYLGFAASHDVWSDGSLVLVPAPGHTPGSVMAFVTLPSGRRFALIGDIVWQMEGIDQQVEKPWLSRLIADHAPAEVRQLIRALGALRQSHPQIELIPAHDEAAMEKLPAWPASAS